MSTEWISDDTADPAELIAAAEARLDAARASGATPPPTTAIKRKPKKAPKRKAAGGAKSKSAMSVKQAKASTRKRPKRRQSVASVTNMEPPPAAKKRAAKRGAKAKPAAKPVTTLVPADAMDDLEREDRFAGSRLGLWGWVALVASIAVLVSGALSGVKAPPAAPTGMYDFVGSDGRHPPALLAQNWLSGFTGEPGLRHQPDSGLLRDFATHLADQPAIASVENVRLVWDHDTHGDPIRVLRTHLTLRRPVLPVLMDDGRQAWVDQTGRVLPGVIRGPDGLPVVRDYRRDTAAALEEILVAWPLISQALDGAGEAGLVQTIHLDHAFHRRDAQRGIVLQTTTGTLIEWGRPGDARFGVNTADKVAMLAYELQLHGDLRRVALINLRFPEPSHILADRGN